MKRKSVPCEVKEPSRNQKTPPKALLLRHHQSSLFLLPPVPPTIVRIGRTQLCLATTTTQQGRTRATYEPSPRRLAANAALLLCHTKIFQDVTHTCDTRRRLSCNQRVRVAAPRQHATPAHHFLAPSSTTHHAVLAIHGDPAVARRCPIRSAPPRGGNRGSPAAPASGGLRRILRKDAEIGQDVEPLRRGGCRGGRGHGPRFLRIHSMVDIVAEKTVVRAYTVLFIRDGGAGGGGKRN